jgi:hypothetical protein
MKTIIIFALLALPATLFAEPRRGTTLTLFGEGGYISQDYRVANLITSTSNQRNFSGYALLETQVSPSADFLVRFGAGHTATNFGSPFFNEEGAELKLSGIGLAFGVGVKLHFK